MYALPQSSEAGDLNLLYICEGLRRCDFVFLNSGQCIDWELDKVVRTG